MVSPAVPCESCSSSAAPRSSGQGQDSAPFRQTRRGKARIVIIPTASSFQDEVVAALGRCSPGSAPGARSSTPQAEPTARASSRPWTRPPASSRSGGNQLKLSQIFAGDGVRRGDPARHRRGAVARRDLGGASIMAEFMISLGDDRSRRASLQPAHARARPARRRRRRPALRPTSALRPPDVDRRSSPNLIGIGIDGDTAIGSPTIAS